MSGSPTRLLHVALLAALPSAAGLAAVEVPARPGERLEVVLDHGGSIEVRGEDRSSVRVEADAEDIEVERQGSTLRVARPSDRRSRPILPLIVVRVPRRFDVAIETAGGDLTLEGVDGELRVRTGGGELHLRGLAGRLDAETRGGDIALEASRVDGRLHSMSGDLTLGDVRGEVRAATMAGDVTCRAVRPRSGGCQALDLSTLGGDIVVDAVPCGARLDTLGGDIRIGSGAGRVEARTMGGDIEFGDLTGSIRATTGGGSVSGRIVEDAGREPRQIVIEAKGGDVSLALPDGFPMTLEVQVGYSRGSGHVPDITSDFPLDLRHAEHWDSALDPPRKSVRGRGTVGDGTHRVEIEARDGEVRLLRRR